MSSKPWNICVPRPGRDKTFWMTIGKAWPVDGGGFRLDFDALPIPTMSEQYGLRVQATIFPPREDERGSRPQSRSSSGAGPVDDDIPF